MTQLNIKLSLLGHKILLNLQNLLRKNLSKEVGSRVVPCKELRDHNSNLEQGQEQAHQIINSRHKEN